MSSATSDAVVWRIVAKLVVPKMMKAPLDDLPERLEFQSRILGQAKTYGDTAVALRKSESGFDDVLYREHPHLEVVEVILDVPAAPEPSSSVEKAGPVFGRIVDLMSFQMGTSLAVGQVTLTDITPPVSVGDERARITFASPPFDRFARSIEMGSIQGRAFGLLPDTVDIDDSKTAAVLRWFVKALDTSNLHDQFIFLWIGLETLCDMSDVEVVEPYVGDCGHPIARCVEPDCGRPTTRLVRGPTIKKFLESYGVQKEQAHKLWRMRQLMHGEIPFDSDKLSTLGALVQPLRAVVAAGLKEKLNMMPEDPPIVARTGLAIHPSMGAAGTAKITEADIRPLTTRG